MFVYEKVEKKDKELYEQLAGRWYDEKYSEWIIDKENAIYIICIGKHGVETPVDFKIYLKGYIFGFYIPEDDILYGNSPFVHVYLPAIFAEEHSLIETIIKNSWRETNGAIYYGSLPRNIDNHIFEFSMV